MSMRISKVCPREQFPCQGHTGQRWYTLCQYLRSYVILRIYRDMLEADDEEKQEGACTDTQ